MHVTRAVAGSTLLAVVLGGCQAPAGQSTEDPARSPIAPAVEQPHPDAERTIPWPSITPVAPAIEPRPTGPDPTIDIPDDVELPSIDPVAPAIEPQSQPDPTVDTDPG